MFATNEAVAKTLAELIVLELLSAMYADGYAFEINSVEKATLVDALGELMDSDVIETAEQARSFLIRRMEEAGVRIHLPLHAVDTDDVEKKRIAAYGERVKSRLEALSRMEIEGTTESATVEEKSPEKTADSSFSKEKQKRKLSRWAKISLTVLGAGALAGGGVILYRSYR